MRPTGLKHEGKRRLLSSETSAVEEMACGDGEKILRRCAAFAPETLMRGLSTWRGDSWGRVAVHVDEGRSNAYLRQGIEPSYWPRTN
jgi:hypothetical protein